MKIMRTRLISNEGKIVFTRICRSVDLVLCVMDVGTTRVHFNYEVKKNQ